MLAAPPLVTAQEAIRVYIDGRLVNFDVPPTVIQGHVLVPLRGIFERLGATVDYDARTQHIVALRGTQAVELTVGSRQARINDTPKLLDVPAFTINGRTLVPLRFVSESLGANVQWIEASQTILIATGTAAAPPSPPPAPQASPPPPVPKGQTLSGRLVGVLTGQNPRIVVRHDGQDSSIFVMPTTAIYRYNADTREGGSAALGALQQGDQVTVQINDQNQADKITATYRVAAAGKIAHVNRDTRTVTLADGQSFVVLSDAEITLNGQSADFSELKVGRTARFSVIEGTNQAYEVSIATQSATPATPAPAPAKPAALKITAPANGATVSAAFVVRGQGQPGSLVVVRVQPRLFGDSQRVQTTVLKDGSWQVAVNVQSNPLFAFPYVVSAVQIINDVQSDPVSVEVNVQ